MCLNMGVEGSNVWYDGWVIPKYARNKKAASYFINYLCRPDVALRNMDACGHFVCYTLQWLYRYFGENDPSSAL